MKIEQVLPRLQQGALQRRIGRLGVRVVARTVARALLLVGLMLGLGRAAIDAPEARMRAFSLAVAGHGFNLLAWETNALKDKFQAMVRRPAAVYTDAEGSQVVKDYLARATRIGEIEATLQWYASESTLTTENIQDQAHLIRLRAELNRLRIQQEAMRPAVEQVIQRQVGQELTAVGFDGVTRPWPPVQFAFTEPPKRLVVSRRDRIDTIYGRMLEAEIWLDEIETAEAKIEQQPNASAYITNIGGLGAFPTMVVDRASLAWILSTVAHEWVHNYLVFQPLGWNYFTSQELMTMNETVAEIVGNEIGQRVLASYYPDMVPPPPPPPESAPPEEEMPPAANAPVDMVEELTEEAVEEEVEQARPEEEDPPITNFRAEMRKTRLEVDRLLAEGKVEAAEEYMAKRRSAFVENGYPLRVLNQAYFAFHGSYVTSPASSSPIGPKMVALSEHFDDIRTFLVTVHSFTSVADLDAALEMYGVVME